MTPALRALAKHDGCAIEHDDHSGAIVIGPRSSMPAMIGLRATKDVAHHHFAIFAVVDWVRETEDVGAEISELVKRRPAAQLELLAKVAAFRLAVAAAPSGIAGVAFSGA